MNRSSKVVVHMDNKKIDDKGLCGDSGTISVSIDDVTCRKCIDEHIGQETLF